eukprot:4742892-Prymnesium_polylepis.1
MHMAHVHAHAHAHAQTCTWHMCMDMCMHMHMCMFVACCACTCEHVPSRAPGVSADRYFKVLGTSGKVKWDSGTGKLVRAAPMVPPEQLCADGPAILG